MPFVAKTQKPTSQDVHVNIELRDANASNIGLELQDNKGKKIDVSQIVIKAGEQHSDTFHIVATNLKRAKQTSKRLGLSFDVALKSIETTQPNTLFHP